MTNPYRAMCAELHTAIQLYTGQNPAAANVPPAELVCRLMDAMAASAALLAQPTPQPEQEVEATPNDDDAWFHELVSEVARVQHVAAGEGQGPRFDLAEAVARCCHPATPPALPHPEATND